MITNPPVMEPRLGSAAVVDLNDHAVSWAPADLPRRDLQLEFMYTVVLALVLAVVVALILAYAMFGRREGVEKRDQMTPETQMIQFNSIRRATTNLRLMSNRRQGPQPQVAARDRYSETLPKQTDHQVSGADRAAVSLPRNHKLSVTADARSPAYGPIIATGGHPRCSIEDESLKDDQLLMAETPNMVLSRDNPGMY